MCSQGGEVMGKNNEQGTRDESGLFLWGLNEAAQLSVLWKNLASYESNVFLVESDF